MLTQAQIDQLKPGDKVRLCGFAGKSYEHYNGMIVEVVEYPTIIDIGTNKQKNYHYIKFIPSIPAGLYQYECDLVSYNNVELIEENSSKTCTCDIMVIMRVGCVCGGQ